MKISRRSLITPLLITPVLVTPFLIALGSLASSTALAEPGQTNKADDDIHHIIIQVNANDPTLMNLALNNASNINKYYMNDGEEADIEIVAYGPGLHMLRIDTSPVKARIASLAQNFDNIHYKACANTLKAMAAKSGKEITLVEAADVVPSGAIHIIQRQEQGWSYLKP